MVKSRTYIATPPGATIKEQLSDRGLSQKEFAVRMGMSEKHISKLINGEVQLTAEAAFRLEMVLGVPAKFWNALEAAYREKIIQANAENQMDADLELAKKMPYREMVKNGWIAESENPVERVFYLRKYFEVINLDIIQDMQLSKIACRRVSGTEKRNLALLAWAQKAKIEARSMETSNMDFKKLQKKLPEIRNMTTKDPAAFTEQLVDTLAECGIALVFLPQIGGSFLHGATFCDGDKIVVGLTIHGKDADQFWFSLFHELGHVLLGHVYQLNGTTDEDEKAADHFAQEVLIPAKEFKMFTDKNDFSKESICRFAEENQILCGIVVGSLQKEGYIPYNRFPDLVMQYA